MITVDQYTTYDYVEAVEILKRKIDKQAAEIERLRDALRFVRGAARLAQGKPTLHRSSLNAIETCADAAIETSVAVQQKDSE